MKFLIQTIHGQIVHDFAFTLLEALRYNEWAGHNYHMSMTTDRDIDEPGWIPVGSVEFVEKYLEAAYGLRVKPRNVPSKLFVYTGRAIQNEEIQIACDLTKLDRFIKSNDKIKLELDRSQIQPGNYQFSELVEFTSEWRAFVWRDNLVGLQNYSGDFTQFPDISTIIGMIAVYHGPCAYTLDVGLVNGQTRIVEVHDFFSCGLYGFADLQLLPLMLGGWFNEYLRNNK